MNPVIAKARLICEKLRSAGFEAFIVGGAVRDFLLGKESKDIDIATNARPEEVENIFKKTIGVGKQFGVIIVLSGSYTFEVATFRKDIGYSDGRRPDQVEFSNAREDVLRRDFTINGLFWHPENDEIIDYVEGRKDLEKRLIRSIGDPYQRFAEDQLRILRAIRFAANLNFSIEDKTWDSILSGRFNLDKVSNERIRVEFEKIITRKHAEKGLFLLKESNLLHYVYCKELAHAKSYTETLIPYLFKNTDEIRLTTALAALYLFTEEFISVKGVEVSQTEMQEKLKILNKSFHNFTFPNKIIKKSITIMQSILTLLMEDQPDNYLLRITAGSIYSDEIFLLLDILKKKYQETEHYICLLHETLKKYENEKILPPPLINGAVLKSFNLSPGPHFKKIIDKSYHIQLDQNIKSKELLIEALKEDLII